MVKTISHVGVWVDDQDAAKAFYTEKLGLEVREDVTLEEFGGYRWLTVGPADQPNVSIILSAPAPPALDEESAKQLMALVSKGALGPGIFTVDDCRKACKELEGKGVELTAQPEKRFYGIDAGFRDPAGNEWRLVEPIEYDLDDLKKEGTVG
jgi:catechol 2,3-dioxygenase-like lactoylglutathione lyase family enzyme